MKYRAYGRVIASDAVLPELQPLHGVRPEELSAAKVSIAVRCGAAPFLPGASVRSGEPPPWPVVTRGDGAYGLDFGDYGAFWVSKDGSWVRCFLAGADAPTWRHLLLDHVLPRALFLLGLEPLHATAVVTDRGVLAFLGPTGSGKSTLAGALGQRGYPVLCDDCLGIESVGDAVVVVPGYPGLRLLREASSALFPRSSARLVAGLGDKRRIMGAVPFADDRASLHAVYVLEPQRPTVAPGLRLEALRPADAVIGLVESVYRIGSEPAARLEQQVRTLARVADAVPVKRCVFPLGWDSVAEVVAAILHDAAADRPGPV